MSAQFLADLRGLVGETADIPRQPPGPGGVAAGYLDFLAEGLAVEASA